MKDGKLNIYTRQTDSSNSVLNSQFIFDRSTGRLVHTNNPECFSAFGQFLLPLYRNWNPEEVEILTKVEDEKYDAHLLAPSGEVPPTIEDYYSDEAGSSTCPKDHYPAQFIL